MRGSFGHQGSTILDIIIAEAAFGGVHLGISSMCCSTRLSMQIILDNHSRQITFNPMEDKFFDEVWSILRT